MASLTSSKTRTLFAFTSPRTIEKIIPELDILDKNFSGKDWKSNQVDFFDTIFESEFYEGKDYPKDPAFAARDRITRAPKALGFVQLKPSIQLTKAGKQLVNQKRLPELFTKQLLKFQLPSPYHTQSAVVNFNVRPYLELLRLINDLGSISKNEIALFFLQMVNYNKFDEIKNEILNFREERRRNRSVSWKTFVSQEFEKQISIIFSDEIKEKKFKTRESSDVSFKNFLRTKERTMRDYADAFFRYIRGTELVTIDKNLHLRISNLKQDSVNFLLENTNRNALELSLKEYENYLFDPDQLTVLEDDINLIKNKIIFLDDSIDVSVLEIDSAKDLLNNLEVQRKAKTIEETVSHLKLRSDIDDILEIFTKIKKRDVPDVPLFLEWNIWRAFAALNHTQAIEGNFIVDLDGMPLNTAPGKKPDIEINYGSFSCIVEVTMSAGETQFNMEGSSVPRHYGDLVRKVEHDAYCIFIAPKVAQGTKAHFFNLNRFPTKHYGGKTKIIPMSLDDFISFLQVGITHNFKDINKLKSWLDNLVSFNLESDDEDVWFDEIRNKIKTWAI
ncbi:AlwI family type II restriction endonuclease [Acinetobacter faecalis]|uniref:AlwI family type II restriction endonuclease n=1 Tax=Acinetobacter faecalis TaxID=2665161 RepID=UPI002A912C16|nr:AlwI family type II restriction endonuclease [Acinetobacter faecalis]MDY6460426.1 AlwI family type II restriction endonuclease [Acinetobacter faecalis]